MTLTDEENESGPEVEWDIVPMDGVDVEAFERALVSIYHNRPADLAGVVLDLVRTVRDLDSRIEDLEFVVQP